MNRKLLTALSITAMLALAAPAMALAGTITMSGSTSVFPLAKQLAIKYNSVTGGKTKFKIVQGGSDIGVADVAAGRVTIGNSSRDPKPGDPGGLVFNKVARDAICVVTNSANTLPNLSQDTIQGIFGGTIKDWKDVPGATASGPIELNVRNAASGTQDAFKNIFMAGKAVSGTAAQKASNGLIQQAVKSSPAAIGYVSLDFIKGIHAVNYNGVTCNLRNAKSSTYGGVRNFWMVTNGAAKGDAKAFLKWVRKSKPANKIVATHWVPLH